MLGVGWSLGFLCSRRPHTQGFCSLEFLALSYWPVLTFLAYRTVWVHRYYYNAMRPATSEMYGDRLCLDNITDYHFDAVKVGRRVIHYRGAKLGIYGAMRLLPCAIETCIAHTLPGQARKFNYTSAPKTLRWCPHFLTARHLGTSRARARSEPHSLKLALLAHLMSSCHLKPQTLHQGKRKATVLKLLPLEPPAHEAPEPDRQRVRAVTIVHYDGLEAPVTIGIKGERAPEGVGGRGGVSAWAGVLQGLVRWQARGG